MEIQLNTDHNIAGEYEALQVYVQQVVDGAINHFSDRITRIEIHVSDENGDKHGADDKRCMMEARFVGHQPFVVTHHAESVRQAIDGAAGKLTRLIEHTLDRLKDQHGHRAAEPLLAE